MKTGNRRVAVVLAVVMGASLAVGMARAEGGKVRQRNGNGYVTVSRTGTAAAIQQRDRDRLRDGSCVSTAVKLQDRTRDRLRDGSCLAK